MIDENEVNRAESEANRERKANGDTSPTATQPNSSDKPAPETFGEATTALVQMHLDQLYEDRKAGKLTHSEFDRKVDNVMESGEMIAKAARDMFAKYLNEGGDHGDFEPVEHTEPPGLFVGAGDTMFHPNAVRFMGEGFLIASILLYEEAIEITGGDAWKLFNAASIIARAIDKVVEGEDLVDFHSDKGHFNDPALRVRNPDWMDR